VVVENVAYLRGRDGIEVRARSAWLIAFRDGQQTSLTLYQTKQEALDAAASPLRARFAGIAVGGRRNGFTSPPSEPTG
jgi:hypothetical protein